MTSQTQTSRREQLEHDYRQARFSAVEVSMYPERFTKAQADAIYARHDRLQRQVEGR